MPDTDAVDEGDTLPESDTVPLPLPHDVGDADTEGLVLAERETLPLTERVPDVVPHCVGETLPVTLGDAERLEDSVPLLQPLVDMLLVGLRVVERDSVPDVQPLTE